MKIVDSVLCFVMCVVIIGMIFVLTVFVKRDERSIKQKLMRKLLEVKNRKDSQRHGYTLFKRLFDIIISVWGILLFFPIIAILTCLIRFDGKARIFRRYECLGRSMSLAHYYKFNVGPKSARKTHLGYVIYKLGLDSIPMIFAVLKGDLSTVGLSRNYKASQKDMDEVKHLKYEKPGLVSVSSIIQIQGYTTRDIDRLYIRIKSVSFDINVLLCAFFNKSTEVPVID